MPTEKENENSNNEGIFGVEPDSIQTYALIHISWEQEKKLAQEIRVSGGEYLTLQDGEDGFGNGFIFNLSPEEIINIANRYGINEFIYGTDPAPSIPYFYKKTEKDSFEVKSFEPLFSYGDLEDFAPECSDAWEDLYFNDFFKESLWSTFGSFYGDNEDDDEE